MLSRLVTVGLLLSFLLVGFTVGNAQRVNHSRKGSKLSQTARAAGYKSGKAEGINDRKLGEPSNFRDESSYQDATEGYSPALGNKSRYQQIYRTAFENGYRDGWNGY